MDLTIVKQPTPLIVAGFDFINDDLRDYCEYFKEILKRPSEKQIKSLLDQQTNCFIFNYAGRNNWKILEKIIPNDCDLLKLSSEYECPFTGFTHTSLWPVFILTDNPLNYVKQVYCENTDRLPWYADIACDASWNYDEDLYKVECHLNKITISFLGPGYTQMFYPNDGSSDFDFLSIEMSNGDSIVFIINKWYNK